jgi:Protein of unknown function (DUF3551)
MRHALVGFTILMLGGAAYSQDRTSSEYCDPICLEFRDGTQDCTYHNYSQCEASRSGVSGECVTNPFLGQCARAWVPLKARHRKHY